MELHPIVKNPRNHNRYCGPAALSIVSGFETGDTARLIRVQTGAKKIQGTYDSWMKHAFDALGYKMALHWNSKGPLKKSKTLTAWLRDTTKERTPGRVFLIIAGNHWQLVSGRKYACGLTGGPVSIKHEKVKRRARVDKVYEITRKPTWREDQEFVRNMLAEEVANQKKFRTQRASMRRKVENYAGKLDVVIDLDYFDANDIAVYIDVPQWLEELREAGQVDFRTVAYDWPDAMDALEGIAAAMKEVDNLAAA